MNHTSLEELLSEEKATFQKEVEKHHKMLAIFEFLKDAPFSAALKTLNPFGYCADYSALFSVTSQEQLDELQKQFKPLALVRLDKGSLCIKPFRYLRDTDVSGPGSIIPLMTSYIAKTATNSPYTLQWWASCLDNKVISISVDVSAMKTNLTPLSSWMQDRYSNTSATTYWEGWAHRVQPSCVLPQFTTAVKGLLEWERQWGELLQKWQCNAKDTLKANSLRMFLVHNQDLLADPDFWNTHKNHFKAIRCDVFDMDESLFTEQHKKDLIEHIHDQKQAIKGEQEIMESAKEVVTRVIQHCGFYTGTDQGAEQFQKVLLTNRLKSVCATTGIELAWFKNPRKNVVAIRLQGGRLNAVTRVFCDFEVRIEQSKAVFLPLAGELSAQDNSVLEMLEYFREKSQSD